MDLKIIDDRFGNKEAVDVVFHQYLGSNNVAIRLVCETGEQWCMASVNVPGNPLSDELVAIKTYSENEGIDAILIRPGIIQSEPLRYLACGQAITPIFRLTSEACARARAVPKH